MLKSLKTFKCLKVFHDKLCNSCKNWKHVTINMMVIVMVTSENCFGISPLSTNSTKWPNMLEQFVGNLLTNCWSV